MIDATELPAIGDDRKGGAAALLRLATVPGIAEKGGLLMWLKTGANMLIRADDVIERLAAAAERGARIEAAARKFHATVSSYDPSAASSVTGQELQAALAQPAPAREEAGK